MTFPATREQERAAVARALAERVLTGGGEFRTTGRALHALVCEAVPHVADAPDPHARSSRLVRDARADLAAFGIRFSRPRREHPDWLFRLTTNLDDGRPAAGQ